MYDIASYQGNRIAVGTPILMADLGVILDPQVDQQLEDLKATGKTAVIVAVDLLPYKDFEDAVQMIAALQIHGNYLVTRNVRNFQPAPLEVVQPVELLAILKR